MRRGLPASLAVLLLGFGTALAFQSAAPAADSGQPVFKAARGVVVFDFVTVGTTMVQDDTITNAGDAPLTFESVDVVGLHRSDFALATDTCSKQTLAPQASCQLGIAFTPSVAGTRAAAVKFTDNTPCDNYITLVGSGVAAAPTATARAAACATSSGGTTTVTTTTPAPAPASPVSAQSVIQVPKTCVSRRTVTLHLKAPKGTTFSKVTVQVHGRSFKTYKGKEIKAKLSLAGLPRGRFTMRIHATTADGHSFTVKHRYTTCVKNYTS